MGNNWFNRLVDDLFGRGQQTAVRAPKTATYIEYGGNIVLPSPDILIDSLIYAFFFTSNGGDKSKLQQLLDQRLNLPANTQYRYEAFSADVVLTFANTGADRSIPDKELGYVPEQEVLCWVPAIEQVKTQRGWVANRFVWFVPYIVVDNVWALAAGREIFGLPKNMGRFEIPLDPENAVAMTSTTYAFKTYGPDAALKEYPFLAINRLAAPPEAKSGAFTPFRDSKHAFQVLKDILLAGENIYEDTSFRFCLHELDDLLHMKVRWVMLKQFRAITDSTSACYQAIVEGPLTITKIHGGGFMHHPYEIRINDLESMPFASDLGLQDGQQSRASIWMRYDFTADLGSVLWEA